MSEYWKSTPKYWCKYCSTYVKDTPLEKTNHEASPRHQGNLKKSLRDLHRSKEKADRDAQYAKAEAARLNGTGSAAAPLAGTGDGKFKTTVNFTRGSSKAATADDRKRQLAELAALGVAVPDDFRKENAMVGDWQITAHKVTWGNRATKDGDNSVFESTHGPGLRKRKLEEPQEEEEEEVKLDEEKKQPRYGRDLRALPANDDDDHLEALLVSTKNIVKRQKVDIKSEKKVHGISEDTDEEKRDQDQVIKDEKVTIPIKQEASEDALLADSKLDPQSLDPEPSEANDIGSIFKKRKKPVKNR